MSIFNAENLGLAIAIIAIIGTIFTIYKSYRDPDIKADKSIDLLNQKCVLTHKALDDMIGIKFSSMENNMSQMSKTLLLLQENDIKHIETRLTSQDLKLEKLFTILEERLPNRNNQTI